MTGRLHLFEAYGVELEYAIVDRRTLAARPIAGRLLEVDGEVVSEVERGEISWSNELVSHVVELKTTSPAPGLAGLGSRFADHVRDANARLAPEGCALLGSGAHPFFDPARETVLWPGEYNEVYRTYDRIFGCRGHGWSNLQSAHLNLPFSGDEEFGRLHAAVRLVLPIIPALAASTPYLDGRRAGPLDARLHVYRHNQDRIPVLVGEVIPEPAFTRTEYERQVFRPIRRALAPHDPDRVLSHYFANSRGAIARFDRGSIEIRVVDLQECPAADLAVLSLIAGVVRALVNEKWTSQAAQRRWPTAPLRAVLEGCIIEAEGHRIADRDYLANFDVHRPAATAADLWRHLLDQVGPDLDPTDAGTAATLLERGSLARSLVRVLGDAPTRDEIRRTYGALVGCLAEDRPFVP